ncbi:hypothetical protein Tco_1107463 [Tanacetum coccineum]
MCESVRAEAVMKCYDAVTKWVVTASCRVGGAVSSRCEHKSSRVLVLVRRLGKELNHGVGDDRITFLTDKAMQHSHSSDDTCFSIGVIDEVKVEELLKEEEEINDNFEELTLEE